MLTCQQVTELVTDYLERRLSFTERMGFQMHIGMCSRCRAYLRQMKMTVRTLGKLPADPIPADVRSELLARFRNARPKNRRARATVPWTLGLLEGLEKVGLRRGWTIVALLLVAAAGALFASGAQHGPVGEPTRCLLVELGAASALVLFLGVLSASQRARLSSVTFTMTAVIGSLAGFGALQATCPMAHVVPHALLFHVGGIALAGALGLAISRFPAFR